MATIYISPSGNDTTGAGTSGNPYLTISKAHTVASSGDTIYCLAGTYTWVSQTFSKALTITAPSPVDNYPVAIFDGAAANVVWSCYSSDVTFENLLFQNVAASGHVFQSYESGVSTIFNCCVFRALLFGNANFSHCFNAMNVTFTACLFDDIYLNGGATDAHRGMCGATNTLYAWQYIFNNCVIYCENSGASRLSTIVASDVSSIKVIADFNNCIVYNGTGGTLNLYYDYHGVYTAVTADYCDNYLMTHVPSGTGNLTSDPLFVDAANGNFNLRPDSPCLNTGTLI